MTTYPISRGVKLRTSATRRFLVVSVMDGRAKVEASTDSAERAVEQIANLRDRLCPAPRCTLSIIDQGARRPLIER